MALRGEIAHAAAALRAVLVTAAVLAVVLLLAGGWHFSGQIRSGALEVGPAYVERDLRVVQAAAGAVTLAPGAGERAQELDEDTTYGLGWPTGYGEVTDVVQA